MFATGLPVTTFAVFRFTLVAALPLQVFFNALPKQWIM
ncbi:unknown protein [Cronobacter turicensis z3032]|uniref:Uncharacterized protein n=1 Tax=Cronobacter turicensis (strain DSM 18703 / CCUG 55852 / LMG 23827 / z3032) TaxID=693216 RepID=C9Y1Z4_CROTZ|nr:unknown protein [Cronobacter turicensis z3032]